MSILIRGLKIPEDNTILLRIFPPVKNGKYKGELYVEQLDCDMDLLGENWGTEIPSPHGRLGDLDHIAEFISNMLKHEDGNLKTWSDYEVLDMIESSPTIIEAEGEEENEKID